MGFSILIGVFVCYVPVLALWALLSNWLARIVLRPLSVPKEMMPEFKRDRLATFFVFIPGIGVLFAMCACLVALVRHLRERRPGVMVASCTLPRIPSIALSELLVMVFSIGAYPLIMSKLQISNAFGMGHMTDEMRAWIFVSAAPLFPLCFASAYLRLDSNKVPRGLTRHEFLFLYPYGVFGLQILINTLLAAVFVLPMTLVVTPRGASDNSSALIWLAQVLGAALLMVILTVLVARRAKREAEVHAAAAEPQPATAAPAEPAVPPQPAGSVGERGTWRSSGP